jgi:hypothetical protein
MYIIYAQLEIFAITVATESLFIIINCQNLGKVSVLETGFAYTIEGHLKYQSRSLFKGSLLTYQREALRLMKCKPILALSCSVLFTLMLKNSSYSLFR